MSTVTPPSTDNSATCATVVELCELVQTMIDSSAEYLDGLRTQCSTSAAFTQQQIREAETKLVGYFTRQLLAKSQVPRCYHSVQLRKYPSLAKWLHVVGLSKKSLKELIASDLTVESLIEMSEEELRNLINKHSITNKEEERRLLTACRNLCKYYAARLNEKQLDRDVDLSWNSWDTSAGETSHSRVHGSQYSSSPKSSRHLHRRPSRSSVPSEDMLVATPVTSPMSPPTSTPTSPAHLYANEHRRTPPPNSPNTLKDSMQRGGKGKHSATPPPKKKMAAWLQPGEGFPLTKSKSHESQLANRVDLNVDTTSLPMAKKKKPDDLRLGHGRSLEALSNQTVDGTNNSSRGTSGQSTPATSSPIRSPESAYEDRSDTGSVPRSPRTPTHVPASIGHSINHRFQWALKFSCVCDLCGKPVKFSILKCVHCKQKFHQECASRAAPSCGLPEDIVRLFAQSYNKDGNRSPSLVGRSLPVSPPPQVTLGKKHHTQPVISVSAFQGADSSSTASSCNSSTSSSPAPIIVPPHPDRSPKHLSPFCKRETFNFPDLNEIDSRLKTLETEQSDMVITQASQKSSDSDKTVDSDKTTDSDRTLPARLDSLDSHTSDGDLSLSIDSTSSEGRMIHRESSISSSLREWDIPYDELQIGEKIGTGWFGTVCKAQWHGDVAVKLLNMDHSIEFEKQLEHFKAEVATFRKTRHENLVLFMGACMRPPETLAIVTSLLKGQTVHTHLLSRGKMHVNKAVMVAMQTSQGMGYLHARGIIHKDLTTKNIFLENGKVVITDFGLFSVAKLCQRNKGNWLCIPPSWLCYLSPEIIRSLEAQWRNDHNLPFTTSSDVYAFGTVLFELLCAEMPFKHQPPDAVIWQVGKGIKQSLGHVKVSRELKELLMMCWAFKPSDRPTFSNLQQIIEHLPKKRLARSPSHPIKLSRSAESIF